MVNIKRDSRWSSHQWFTLIAVCIASFQEPVATTMTVVALPDIEQSLNASFAELQWILNAYVLVFAAFVLTAGALMDLFGRRLIFIIGMFLFTLGFLCCGLATEPLWLSFSRGLLGLGAALSLGLPLLINEFEGRDRASAFGIWGVAVCVGAAFGPLFGGVITDAFNWRWVFLINVPICAIVIALTFAQVRESRDPNARYLDWVGLISFTSMFFMLMFALIEGNEQGWTSPLITGAFISAGILLIVFVAAEHRHPRPMFDLSLFRLPTFVGASTLAVVIAGTFFTLIVYLPFYFQGVLDYSATQAGLMLVPMALPLLIMGPLAGKLATYLPSRVFLSGGLCIISLGAARMATVNAESGLSTLLGGMILSGIGAGLINGELSNVAVSVVSSERSGMASGINHTMRQLGFGVSIAGLGAIFSYQTRSFFLVAIENTSVEALGRGSELAKRVVAGDMDGIAMSLPFDIQDEFSQAAKASFTSGISDIFTVAAVVAMTGAVLTFFLVRDRDVMPTSQDTKTL